MAKPRSRRRRETAEIPTGIGGRPPHPEHGPVAALRVLGKGFEVPLDLARSEFRIGRAAPPSVDVQLPLVPISSLHALIKRDQLAIEVIDQGSKNGVGADSGWGPYAYIRMPSVRVYVGQRFGLGSVHLLALDAPTYELVDPLEAYCGPGRHGEVDYALEAAIRAHLLILCGSRIDDVLDIAHTLHDHSVRKDYPFTKLDAVPRAHHAIDELCTRAAFGTILLDLTKPFAVPLHFARHLFSEHFHLWTMLVAPTVDQAVECLGNVWSEPRRVGFYVCELGFSRRDWHLRMKSPTFTKLG